MIAAAIACAVIVALAVAVWYVNDYYHADDAALEIVDGNAEGLTVRELADGSLAFMPDEPKAGLIFYPGAKVQPEAYAALLARCAERNVLCVLVKPLFNLAILSSDAASGVQSQFGEVDVWLIGGHSMGGVAAADYASRHEGDFQGVVFLASYPAADLSGYGGTALSLAGDCDEVLNRDAYENARALLPETTHYAVISGGNHAYFGNYGEQAGDGKATITRESQQQQAADAIADLAQEAKARSS